MACDTAHVLKGHKRAVMSVAISKDDKFMVSGSGDTTVRIWDTAMGELLRELKGHSDTVKAVVVSPGCQHIASGSYRELRTWKTDGHFERDLVPLAINWVTGLAYSHDGQRVVSCNNYSTVWNTAGRCLPGPDDTIRNISSIAYAPDEREIISGHKDRAVIMWNTDTNKTHRLDGFLGALTSVAVSFDGSCIASGSNDKAAIICDTKFRETKDEKLSQEPLRFVG